MRVGVLWTAFAVAAIGAAPGCSFEDARPGVADVCANPTGATTGCQSRAVDSPETACDKLVACGAIPVDDENGADWADCVERIYDLDQAQQTFAVACIAAAECETLLRIPDQGRLDNTCLEHGEN